MAGSSTNPFEIVCRDVAGLSFHPNGTYFVTGNRSGSFHQWSAIDRGTQLSLWTMNTKEQIDAVAVSADGRWIVSSGTGNKAIVWSTLNRERVVEVAEHTGTILSLDISNDSACFASCSEDNTVRIFDVVSGGRLIPPLRPESGYKAVDVKFSPDASQIAIATYHAGIQNNSYGYRVEYRSELSVAVYNASSGSNISRISRASNHGVYQPASPGRVQLAWSSDCRQIFLGSPDKIIFFDTSTSTSSEWPIHHNSSQKQVSIVTSGKFIAYSAGSLILFLDCVSHERIGQTINHATPVNCIAISDDGRRLACVHHEGITVHGLEGFIPEEYLPGILSLPLMRVSTTTLKSWVQGNPTETAEILSDEIARRSNPTHDSLAICALARMHLGEWRAALEASERSLQVKPSLIGRIAKSVALVGAGEQEAAFDEFELVFWDCDPNDNKLLWVIKSILLFMCSKPKKAISRLRYFIDACDGQMKGICCQVLGMMYLKQEDYGNAAEILGTVKNAFTTEDRGPLMSLFIIFNWNFCNLKFIAWKRACETLYASGSVKEIGDTLLKMVGPLPEDAKERAHGNILQEIITRSGEVTLLAWTGKSSTCNSCLPSSPAVYVQTSISSLHTPQLEVLQERIEELRTIVPLPDALMAYALLTRSQRPLFAQFRLLLSCIVFRVKALSKEQEGVYRAETVELGDVTFTTTDSLPLSQPRQLVFVNPWIDHLRESHGLRAEDELDMESNTHRRSPDTTDIGLIHEPMIEEVQAPSNRTLDMDIHTQALELIALLGQPFSALLLSRQPDGAYERIAADHEIIVHGIKDGVLKNIRVEVLEVR